MQTVFPALEMSYVVVGLLGFAAVWVVTRASERIYQVKKKELVYRTVKDDPMVLPLELTVATINSFTEDGEAAAVDSFTPVALSLSAGTKELIIKADNVKSLVETEEGEAEADDSVPILSEYPLFLFTLKAGKTNDTVIIRHTLPILVGLATKIEAGTKWSVTPIPAGHGVTFVCASKTVGAPRQWQPINAEPVVFPE